ncbi:unnamed protein product [Allacma fusca]|uniref:Uncharacterized protein n=1 Tax=Allacma fusca TaxID=39272 RepID=A0A8J2L3W1_9HEXA|nr:unnamed protein product [Allacma fusca]
MNTDQAPRRHVNPVVSASTIQILSHRKDSNNEILRQTRERISEINGKLLTARVKYQELCTREVQIQNLLCSRKFDVGVGSVKIKALLVSCGNLEGDIERGSETLQEAKQELSQCADENLTLSVGFATMWSCTQAGKDFRKLQEVTYLNDATEAKTKLELELRKFLENEKKYEDALREKSEYELRFEKERQVVLQKEQELIPVIQSTKRNIEDLTKDREDCFNTFVLEKDRLEKRIKNARSSIERIKSRNASKNGYSQQQNWSVKANSVVGFVATYNNYPSPSLSTGHSYLELPVLHSLQDPAEKYRRLELNNATIDYSRNGTLETTTEDSMILVPLLAFNLRWNRNVSSDDED